MIEPVVTGEVTVGDNTLAMAQANWAKLSPATQMRGMLAALRRGGAEFDRAWECAWARIRWPHDTEHRREWKQRLEEDREVWRRAYERRPAVSQSLRAVYSLLILVSSEDRELAA